MARYPNNFLYNLLYHLFFPFMRVFFGFRVIGQEFLPKTGGVIVAVNHASNYDPILMGLASPRQLCFLAKIELFKNALLGTCFRHLGAIPLRRGAADTQALKRAIEVLKEQKALLVFPEGTRTKTGKLQRARHGVGMLAVRCRVPIVPAYLSGSFHMFRRLFQHRVFVHFGEPIFVEKYKGKKLSVKDLYRQIGEDTMACIREIQNANYH